MSLISHLPKVKSESSTVAELVPDYFEKLKQRFNNDCYYPGLESERSYFNIQRMTHKKRDFSKFFGALKTGMTTEEINRKLRELREEWDI